MDSQFNRRVLIVDDSEAIHEDFRKILPCAGQRGELNDLLNQVFGEDEAAEKTGEDLTAGVAWESIEFELQHVYQGLHAVDAVRNAVADEKPFSVVFTDVRMPPGIDGVKAAKRMWDIDPNLEIVVCTAFSDHSWDDILDELGATDQLQFVRKPFDTTTIRQMTLALTRKWNLAGRVRGQVEELEGKVAERTTKLTEKVQELEQALAEIKQLQGILPMCVYCHKIRMDNDYWQRVDEYIRGHSVAEISHGICPDCYAKHIQPEIDRLDREAEPPGEAPAATADEDV